MGWGEGANAHACRQAWEGGWLGAGRGTRCRWDRSEACGRVFCNRDGGLDRRFPPLLSERAISTFATSSRSRPPDRVLPIALNPTPSRTRANAERA